MVGMDNLSGKKFDFIIIGSGIIGISIGIGLLESSPHRTVLIQEKELEPASHASGRNSGVLHAGFYYTPDSLKARFCRLGNAEISRLCLKNDIPMLRTGKVVVSQSNLEDQTLQTLYARGIKNGVDVVLHDSKQLSRFEPLASTNQFFLWSPTTSIADVTSVNRTLLSKFLKLGGKIQFGIPVQLQVNGREISSVIGPQAKFYINAAGAGSIKIAHSIGAAKEYSLFPFLGLYYINRKLQQNPTKLVYPVPHPTNAFLGIHTTKTLDGYTKIGPTAIPVLGIEQYDAKSLSNATEIGQVVKSLGSMVGRNLFKTVSLITKESRNYSKNVVLSKASALVPSLMSTKGWEKYPSGIRAQLVHMTTGELEQDFVVRYHNNSIHILNAVSPGWTSALPFGRWIALKVQEALG